MTTIVGNDGDISGWPAAHGDATQAGLLYMFRLTFEQRSVETTGFTNSNVRTHRGGLLVVSGSAVGSMDNTATTSAPGVTSIAAAGAEATFVVTSGNTYAFDILLSNITVESNKRSDEASVNFDFVMGDDDTSLVETW